MSFHCTYPDFSVRSIIDNQAFAVSRKALCTSEVFREFPTICSFGSGLIRFFPFSYAGNMFSCCDDSHSEVSDQSMDLLESSASLCLLLTLLHSPPDPPTLPKQDGPWDLGPALNTDSSVIPLPILAQLFLLADKYALSDSVTKVLSEHLLANAPLNPLFVYGFALSAGFPDVASKACRWLKPMALYSQEEIKIIPTVEAYHNVIRLQDLRVKALKRILLEEEIFPHGDYHVWTAVQVSMLMLLFSTGYGACSSHLNETQTIWHSARVNLARKVETCMCTRGLLE